MGIMLLLLQLHRECQQQVQGLSILGGEELGVPSLDR